MARGWAWLWCVGMVGLAACGAPSPGDVTAPPVEVPLEDIPGEPPPPSQPSGERPSSATSDGGTAMPRPALDGGPAPDAGGTPPDAGTPDPPPARRPFAFPPLQTDVPLYEVTLPPGALERFEANPYADEVPATFTFQGKSESVHVRLRGASARFWPKKSWRIEFPEGVKFDGRRKLNLIAEYQDATLMVEKLGYDMLAAMGAPAPRARFVRLNINGRFYGVFLDVERVDKNFLDAHDFVDDDANIYRCGGKDCEFKLWRASYQRPWTKENNEEDPSTADLQALLEAVNQTPEPDFPRVLAQRLELEDYLSAMAMDALISNFVTQDSKSYLVHDRATERWTYVPWDVNNADARWWPSYSLAQKPLTRHPLFHFTVTDAWGLKLFEKRQDNAPDYALAFSQLSTRIVFNPELRGRLCERLERALDELYAPDVIQPRLRAMHALLLPYVSEDPFLTVEDAKNRPRGVTGLQQFRAGLAFLQRYVTERTAFLRAELQRHREQRLGLALSAFDPRGGWVELRNYGRALVRTRGLVLTKSLRHPLQRNVPDREVPPGGTVRFTAAELGLTVSPVPRTDGATGFPPSGELGLFTGDSRVGALDVLFYGELPVGRIYARDEREPTRWEVRQAPAP